MGTFNKPAKNSRVELSRTGREGIRLWWFTPAVLVGLFITVLWFIHNDNNEIKRNVLAGYAESTAERINLRLKGNLDYLLLLAKERGSGALSPKSFQERASRYVADHPELICINWVDAGYLITDVAPLAPNRHIVGLRLDLPEPRRASRLAVEMRQPVYTRPFVVIQGELAFELWVPVYRDDVFLGLLGGIYSYKMLLSLVSPKVLEANYISLVDGSGKVLLELPQKGSVDEGLVLRVPIAPHENGVFLLFKGYGRGKQEWSLLILELFCLALLFVVVYAMWGLKREIDMRTQTEEDLRRERALLRCLIDAPSDLIFIKDREGVYLACNRASEDFIGLPESEQIGKTDFDFFDRERAEAIRDFDRQVLAEAKPHRIEEWMPNRDGVRIPLDTLKAPYYGPDGKVLGLVGISRDITDRKKAEEKLKLAVDYNRSLIEASLDPLVTIGQDGRIKDVNVATERVTGYAREGLIGRLFSDFFTEPGKAEAGFQRAFEAGTVHDYELEIRHRDGHTTPVLFNASIYRDETGNIAGVFAAARDISERRDLERQLRHSLKMEAVGTLAGGVAHEFNNIMTAVIGYGNLLKMKLADDATLLPKVDALLKATERAATLVRSLLSFSRKQGSSLKPIDLNELVARGEELLRSMLRKDIELKISLVDNMLPVNVDNSQIEQVLVNLVNNAQDAMPGGGEITIRTESLELDGKFFETHGFGAPGRYAVMTFSDSGEGMDDEIRQKIFEPFFTTKDVGKGPGLGLSICYGIIKQHKGYIVCESELGKGTDVYIYLPMAKAEADDNDSKVCAPLSGGTETILLAEDNSSVLEVAREVLEEYGYSVIEAVDGRDALDKFIKQGDEIALVIIDVIMPKMNGRELYREIVRLKPEIKVIISSGFTANVFPEVMKGLKGLPFLPKPFEPEQLLRSIRDILDEKG